MMADLIKRDCMEVVLCLSAFICVYLRFKYLSYYCNRRYTRIHADSTKDTSKSKFVPIRVIRVKVKEVTSVY